MSENYGTVLWSRLVTAPRPFLNLLRMVSRGAPLVLPRGALFLALEHEQDALRAGRIMVSQVDMARSEPCDAQADELETAIAIDRIHASTTMKVKIISHKWGGLLTFAPDHEPVIGRDPEADNFIWLAGQGGNGVMAGAAAARLAASIAIGGAIPPISRPSVSLRRMCLPVHLASWKRIDRSLSVRWCSSSRFRILIFCFWLAVTG